MSLTDDARNRNLGQPQVAPGRPKVTIDPGTGLGTAEAVVARDESFDAILGAMLPEVPVDVLEVLEVRAWGHPEDPNKYVKARVARRLDGGKTGRELLDAIPRRRSRKPAGSADSGERTLVVALADPQIGKSYERGGGTEETIARVRSVVGQIPGRVRALKKAGRPVSRIVLANMGDTCEGTCGSYDDQLFTIDLNESDQMAVALDLYDDAADVCAGLVPEVVCTVVNSNHDQARQSGKYVTDSTDSRAFTIWRSLARAYSKNPDRYGHVTWHIPDDPLVSTLDLHGTGVAFTHGHKAERMRGGAPGEKIWNWWDGQVAGRLPAGDCPVLISAHFHHFFAKDEQDRLSVGCPALDGGSQWLTDRSGRWSSPGLLTLTVDEDGWGDIHVIRP